MGRVSDPSELVTFELKQKKCQSNTSGLILLSLKTHCIEVITMWNLPPPPEFQGLREDLPLTCYVRHLPHWRQIGATYFVTFRLADSLPQSKLNQLARMKAEWERQHPAPRTNEILELWAQKSAQWVEHWLDQGHGKCALKDDICATEVINTLRHFDNVRYELDCYVVMSNHVHVIVRPFEKTADALETVLKSWKSFSAHGVNRVLSRSGPLWQEENYDRIIRDEEHLWRTIQYIGRNLDKAGFCRESNHLWIRPEWESLGWTFEWRRAISS